MSQTIFVYNAEPLWSTGEKSAKLGVLIGTEEDQTIAHWSDAYSWTPPLLMAFIAH